MKKGLVLRIGDKCFYYNKLKSFKDEKDNYVFEIYPDSKMIVGRIDEIEKETDRNRKDIKTK